MDTSNTTVKEQLINCEICLKEVPSDLAKNSEVDDYIVFFCGLDCYDKWHKQAEKSTDVT